MGDRPLHIGVDAREIIGRPTGVGRYLGGVLHEWLSTPDFPHRLTLFVSREPPQDLREGLRGAGWQVVEDMTGGTVWEQLRLPRALKAAGVDVLFAVGYTAPLRRMCPFVVTIHDVSFFAHPEWFRTRERIRRQRLTKWSAERAASVLTVSEFSAAEIVRWLGIPRERIRLAPQGPPEMRMPPHDGPRTPMVLFVGSLFNRRHLPELIAGFATAQKAVPDAHLVLVGDNRTHPPVDPIEVARSVGLTQMEWRGYVPDAELHALYSRARVFAFLSDYEGFAMAPMEAIAHGAAALLLDTPVAREVYGDGARLITANPDTIANTLIELLTSETAHRDLVEAGRRRLALYSWSRTAQTILTALEQAAAR